MSEKLMLVDGHSILNRAYYGMPYLTNGKGVFTGAVYGFLTILFRFLKEEKPDYLMVAFDIKAPTFRHELYPEYKGTRKPMPEELRTQVPLMHEVLKAMGVCIVEQAGLEADDILGTLAKKAAMEGVAATIVTGDKDLLQIADETIKIKIPSTSAGKTVVKDYYAKDVMEEYGVDPLTFIELKALMGDKSDNIPGVDKVGPKTAQDLLVTYGSLDGIYEHVEEIKQKALKQHLIECKENAYLSKVLATINTKADLTFDHDKMRLGNLYTKEAYQMFAELSFKNFLSEFDQETAEGSVREEQKVQGTEHTTEAPVRETPKLISAKELSEKQFQKFGSLKEMKAYLKQVEKEGCLSIYAYTSPQEGLLLAITSKEKTGCVILWNEDCHEIKKELGEMFASGKTTFRTYDAKALYSFLALPDGSPKDITKDTEDVHLLAYLLDPVRSEIDITDIGREEVGLVFTPLKDVLGKLDPDMALIMQADDVLEYASFASYTAYHSFDSLWERVRETKMDSLYRDMEMPLSFVLYRMEQEGILMNKSVLDEISLNLEERIKVVEEKIYQAAGKSFNINSPKQLGELLFDEMKIPVVKKTKTGYSTSAEVLEELAATVPFVEDVLYYRMLTKLRSTYAEGLKDYIGTDGKIHTHFNQTVTATGRISSTEPNLQNIPMRSEEGRLLRKAFVPSEGKVFCDADYSQIELRLLAAMSQDENLKNAFMVGEDIHRSTASKVFHTPYDEVSDLQRRNAKAVNFGIVYGISAYGLAKDLKISNGEAKEIIDSYFASYPGIYEFLEKAKSDARELGYSITHYGRRRPNPEIRNSNFQRRSFGERVAMNAPIQGTAADIMKLATILVYERLLSENLQARIVLQIHDELVVETPESEKEIVLSIMEEEMEKAADLGVRLEAKAQCGQNLYETK